MPGETESKFERFESGTRRPQAAAKSETSGARRPSRFPGVQAERWGDRLRRRGEKTLRATKIAQFYGIIRIQYYL